MDSKKTLLDEYKQRKIVGGIYRVTNQANGRYLLGYALNIQSKQNAFDFATLINSCFDPRLKEDKEAFGNRVFAFEILETLEKKKEQTEDQFRDDLEALAKLIGEKLDPAKRY